MARTRASSNATVTLASGDRSTEGNATSFVAFKALPVGSTHVRNGSSYTEPADDLSGAASSKEAVNIIVDAIVMGSIKAFRIAYRVSE